MTNIQDLSHYSPTELLKLINDSKFTHDNLKQETIDLMYNVDMLEKKINDKLEKIKSTEEVYIALIEELNNRTPNAV